MKKLTDDDIALLNELGELFYEVVPEQYQTFCATTSSIAVHVLQYFAIKARLLPCQVWYTTPDQNYVVGFVGRPQALNKWDGHVVCECGDFFIDTALRNFHRDFGLNVPRVVINNKFNMTAQPISRVNLSETHRIWWHRPPENSDLTIPETPPEFISQYATQLIMRLEQKQNMAVAM